MFLTSVIRTKQSSVTLKQPLWRNSVTMWSPEVHCCLIDISEVFDTVNHTLSFDEEEYMPISIIRLVYSGQHLTFHWNETALRMVFIRMVSSPLCSFLFLPSSNVEWVERACQIYLTLLIAKPQSFLSRSCAHSLKVSLLLGNCRDVTLQHVIVRNTTGVGLLGINVLGQSNFIYTPQLLIQCIQLRFEYMSCCIYTNSFA